MKTQIICTVTESVSEDMELLKELINNGMSVARIKFDGYSLEVRPILPFSIREENEGCSPLLNAQQSLERLMSKVKSASKELGKPCAIMLDTKVGI